MVNVREVPACTNEQKETIRQQRVCDKAQCRVPESDILFQKLFEGNVMGHVSDESSHSLSQGHEEELKTLKEKISVLSSEVQIANEKTANADCFLKVAEKYAELYFCVSILSGHSFMQNAIIYSKEDALWTFKITFRYGIN